MEISRFFCHADFYVKSIFFRDDSSDDELSDGEISKLMIVTPMRPKKHEGFDRTGDFCSRVKMSQDLAQVINDGLVYYEEHNLEDQEEEKSWIESKNVNVISQAEFDKLKPPSSAQKVINPTLPPPHPPSSPHQPVVGLLRGVEPLEVSEYIHWGVRHVLEECLFGEWR